MKRIIKDDIFPTMIDFDYLEKLEVDYYPGEILYKGFLGFLNIPKIITMSFIHLLSSETEKRNVITKSTLTPYEKQFFKIFDEMYSLEDKRPRFFRRKTPNTGKLSVGIN